MKLSMRHAHLIRVLIAGIILAPLWIQSSVHAQSTNELSRDTFVIRRSHKGEAECREATDVETNRFSLKNVSSKHHVIYSGAPLRSALPYGRDRWQLSGSQLSLQPSAGLRIVLHGTTNLEQNQTAKNAFIVAANRWEALISTPMTVVLDVDFGPTFFGEPYGDPDILGATGSALVNDTYPNVRQRLNAGASTALETEIYSALPVGSVPIIFGSDLSSLIDMRITKANSRALGLSPDIVDPGSLTIGQGDAGIGFNSAFPFDFNPADGITADQVDFDSVATHEIGHSLGFTSRNGNTTATHMSVWDLFRFSNAAPTIDITTFTSRPRVMSKGVGQLFWSNHLSTYATFELSLSSGGPNPAPNDGDGRQSSHWKDDVISGGWQYIGLMDPTLADGLRRTITENDIHAIDILGYSTSVPAPIRPPNDNFASSITITGVSGSTTGSNVNGTRETGEPVHATNVSDKSIWYTWTATLNGPTTFTTAGSAFDTSLAVYKGDTLAQLVSEGSNDNVTGNDHTSSVRFVTRAGTTYRIAVDSWNSESGNVTLNWNSTGTPPEIADVSFETLTASPNPVRSLEDLTITAVLKNNGPSNAVVKLRVLLPTGLNLISCTPFCNNQPVANGTNAELLLGDFPPKTTRTVTINASVSGQAAMTLNIQGAFSPEHQIADPNLNNNSLSTQVNVTEPVLFSGVKQLAAQPGGHVLALRNGTVWAWGPNKRGELGNGLKEEAHRSTPVQVENLMNVRSVAAGTEFSLALKNDGTVWGWGNNERGGLGVGSEVVTESLAPTRLETIDSVTAISVSGFQVVALKSDGSVWTWGVKLNGILPTTYEMTPVRLSNLTNIVKIFASGSTGFAIRNDGTVFGWGFNSQGQLGLGSTSGVVMSPVEIPAFQNAIKIAASSTSTLALKNDGSVWSCGSNAFGKLGLGLSGDGPFPTPAQIPGLTASDISVADHAVVLLTDGTLKTFGANSFGELGLGVQGSFQSSPVSVPGLNAVTSVIAMKQSTLVTTGELATGATLRGWGRNEFGQLASTRFTQTLSIVSLLEVQTLGKTIFSTPGGVVYNTSQLFLVTGSPDSSIHYSLNGQDPSSSDPVATPGNPILLSQSTTVKARTFRNGFTTSPVTSAQFILSPTANMIDDARLFVRQQYIDFLGREPDSAGWDFWTNEIASCGSDQECINIKRINVSAAFFLSIEFQQTSFLAERAYKAAYGDADGVSTFNGTHSLKVPTIKKVEMIVERAKLTRNLIVGQPGWEAQLEANKNEFYSKFIHNVRFHFLYPPVITSGVTIVDALNANAGFPLSTSERNALIAQYEASNRDRIIVLRAIFEHPNFISSESNRAFVLMQYLGYMQRGPNSSPDQDHTGYDFWLTKLNQFNGNFVNAEMVKAFIVSQEYRDRFKP